MIAIIAEVDTNAIAGGAIHAPVPRLVTVERAALVRGAAILLDERAAAADPRHAVVAATDGSYLAARDRLAERCAIDERTAKVREGAVEGAPGALDASPRHGVIAGVRIGAIHARGCIRRFACRSSAEEGSGHVRAHFRREPCAVGEPTRVDADDARPRVTERDNRASRVAAAQAVIVDGTQVKHGVVERLDREVSHGEAIDRRRADAAADDDDLALQDRLIERLQTQWNRVTWSIRAEGRDRDVQLGMKGDVEHRKEGALACAPGDKRHPKDGLRQLV